MAEHSIAFLGINFPTELTIHPLSEQDTVITEGKRTFEGIGNYSITGFQVKGGYPNLDKGLREQGISPLEHYKVKGVLFRDGKATVYITGLHHYDAVSRMDILIEIKKEDATHYYLGQVDDDAVASIRDLQLPD